MTHMYPIELYILFFILAGKNLASKCRMTLREMRRVEIYKKNLPNKGFGWKS